MSWTDFITKDELTALKNEVKMAQTVNEQELEPILEDSLARYMGTFIPSFGKDWDIILNEVYPIIQYNLPSIFFRNPRAFLKPKTKTFITKKRDPISGEKVEIVLDATKSAKTQEHILNHIVVEIQYKKEVRKVLLDALLFPYGVMWHGYKGDFGMTDEQSIFIKNEQIFVKRIAPQRFIHDPAVTMSEIDEGRWVGRIIDIRLKDLIEDDKLDVDKTLKGFYGYGDKVGTKDAKEVLLKSNQGTDYAKINALKKPLIDKTTEEYRQLSESRFVRVYEIFLRPTNKQKREGKKGLILLLTDEQFKPLRINDWKIKAEGFPAHILEFNTLNDSIFGLADVDTYSSIADQKNVITNLQIRNAQENSKTWVGVSQEGADEHDIERIKKGDQTIILFESGNPKDRMFVASPGGSASSELYLIDQRIQRNLEDKSGVTDLKRGFIQSGEESAASVKIRNAGSGARPAYRQDLMADFLKGSFLYINQLNKQFVTVKDAVRIMGTLDIEWSEEFSEEEIQAPVDVDIDVISMLPENPEKELVQLNTLLALMIQALQAPAIMLKIKEEGKTFNLSPLIEQMMLRMRIRDPEMFRSIKPEESQGFVSVQQIREAKENVTAAITGQPIPFPPKNEDDHVAKLEVYTSIKGLLQLAGQMSDALEQLIMIHTALLQELEKKESKPNQTIDLKQPKIQTVGTM